jgi:hypothetical protein
LTGGSKHRCQHRTYATLADSPSVGIEHLVAKRRNTAAS